MSIEKELNIKRFYNEHHKIRVNLMHTLYWLKGEIKHFLDQFDLTQQQFNALRILRGSYPNPVSTREITLSMVDRYADTSRVIDRLCKKGLVIKENRKDDRRLVDVVINEAGLKILEKIDAQLSELDKVTDNLSSEKIELLNDLLNELREGKSNC